MPRIYIHYGTGSAAELRGDMTVARDAAEGSTISISSEPAPGWQFSYARLDLIEQRTDPVTFVMPARDVNLYFFYATSMPPSPDIPPPPPPPPIWDTAETVIDTVGSACEIVRKRMYDNQWFSYRNTVDGGHYAWSQNLPDIRHSAEGNQACYLPQPPTLADWQTSISGMLKNFMSGIGDALGGVLGRIGEIEKRVDDTFAGLEAWLEERIIAILLRALDREAEEAKK